MMTKTQTTPSAVQCWAAEKIVAARNTVVEDITKIKVSVNIDHNAGDYGLGGIGWYSHTATDLIIQNEDPPVWIETDLEDFDIESFVEECIAAKQRWLERKT